MLLTWPDEAVVVRSEMDVLEAVETVRSPYSLNEATTDYGGRLRRGQVTVGRFGSGFPGHAAGHAFEAFLEALSNPGNWTEIPVGRPSIPDYAPAAALANRAVVDGLLRGTLGLPPGVELAPGQLCRIGLRTYRVTTFGAGNAVTLSPGVMPEVGNVVQPTTTVRARLAPGSRRSKDRDADWMGPWVLSWDEYLRD